MVASIYDEMPTDLFGLEIETKEYIGPRFTGRIKALAVNHGSVPVRLVPGIQIGRMSLHEIFNRKDRKRKRRLKILFVVLNSVLTGLIAYAVEIDNWPFILGSSITLVILNIVYMFQKL